MIALLNNFSDFEVAVRMYQIAKKPLSKVVFKRAAFISSGEEIHDDVVDLLFYVFDEAGDGHLSHSEFVNVMKTGVETGVSASQKPKDDTSNLSVGSYFRKCIRSEMIKS
eukprot:sb/3477322/